MTQHLTQQLHRLQPVRAERRAEAQVLHAGGDQRLQPFDDIAGGAGLGLTTALVRSGILADLDEHELKRLYAEHGARPDYTIDRFAM